MAMWWSCHIIAHTMKRAFNTEKKWEKNTESESIKSKKKKKRSGMFNICTKNKANNRSNKKRNIILTNIRYKSDGVYGIK